ncbi:MAG TPA: thioredoxin domain-containing protein [Polyangiales bacterium]
MSTTRKTRAMAWLSALLMLSGFAAAGRRLLATHQRPAEPVSAVAAPAKPVASGDRFKIPVTASQPSKGSAQALVTLIEWSDLRCQGCAGIDPVVDGVLKDYGDQVRLVWRNYPKTENADSLLAAEFAMEAHTQAGKFWPARQLLAAHPEALNVETLLGFAKQLGLDERAVKQALDQHSHGPHLANDGYFAQAFGVTDLPALFVNGVRVPAPLTAERVRAAVDAELPHARQLVTAGVAAQDVYAELTKHGLWKVGDAQKLASGL